MDQDVQERLLAGSKRVEVRKGDILLRAGDTKERSFFVMKGCIRSYVIDSGGKEHVLQFAPEGWFVGDMKSAVRRVPASIFIDALEPSMLIDVAAERIQRKMANDIAA